jgi:hypothetical protein
MFYHLKNFVQDIQSMMDNIRPFIGKNEKSGAYDTEYDLTESNPLREFICDLIPVISSKFNQNLRCYNYWISVTPPGEKVVKHNHLDNGETGVIACAVLYVQADENCGVLRLDSFDIDIVVSHGDLVLFPSECIHSVPKNDSSRDRICVAFDFVHF